MAYTSFQEFCEVSRLVKPGTFVGMQQTWLEASGNGGTDTFPEYICRQGGCTETSFLDRVAEAYDFERIDMTEVKPTLEAIKRIPSKVAGQYQVNQVK